MLGLTLAIVLVVALGARSLTLPFVLVWSAIFLLPGTVGLFSPAINAQSAFISAIGLIAALQIGWVLGLLVDASSTAETEGR